MPIVINPSVIVADATTTTVQDILDCVTQELQDRFAVGGSDSVLIHYTDRIQKMILRKRKWNFMLSEVQQFITRPGQNKYWIGATAGQSAGQVDTLLNLEDIQELENGSVVNVTDKIELGEFEEAPQISGLERRDGSYQPGKPRMFRSDVLNPYVLTLYPAPDRAEDFRLVPNAPDVTTVAGGALADRTYFVRVTFVDSADNESEASVQSAEIFVPSGELLKVYAPQPYVTVSATGVDFNLYNVYAGTVDGSEELQTASPIGTGTNWTEPVGGLIAGVSAPTTNNLSLVGGYVITFRYYKTITTLDDIADVLQIPSRYEDVVCAGVCWLGAKFNKDTDQSEYWRGVFQEGVRQMNLEQNPFPNDSFMRPDKMAYVNKWFRQGS